MKKITLYLTISSILLIILLFRLEFVYVAVSPNNSYSLTEAEKKLISNAILQFRERVEKEKFNEIAEDLSKGRQNTYWENIILRDIQNNHAEYGKPLSWEIFRVAQPQIDKVKGEMVYHIDCLTKFEKGEIYESFVWLVKDNNEINLIANDLKLHGGTQWRIEERDKQKVIIENYPNEIIIPYTDRYIEFRY